MPTIKDLYKTADWKEEKHVPVIVAPDKVKKGEWITAQISVGEKIAHPNTTAHHIRWIDVYFQADGAKFPYHIGKVEFNAHGESTEGPDTSSIYTHSQVQVQFKTDKPGTILATSYCNIHGLWENTKTIAVE
jgi:superoxide reductase